MSWPTSIRQHVHDGDDGRRARNNEKVTKNSNSNKLGPSAATKKVREKKIETGKEGKWSIINFACDLVRFLGLHDNWPQPTLSISLCQNLFPHTLLCVHRFSPSCLELFRFYEFQINFFFSFHVQHFFCWLLDPRFAKSPFAWRSSAPLSQIRVLRKCVGDRAGSLRTFLRIYLVFTLDIPRIAIRVLMSSGAC